ncbi:aldo/keto reductase [Streptomyces sp. NBC_00893]|uniref:aldo/keto reductase n=1 Tax=Streptomyces sp. NBC_00893 TaxID=2975862 RepID=UPI00224CA901|nr:aldo/keto reductase [Streptomyces sp. NBC_00893]MCX4850067.1 aldo/keto reductase [Streptomyces sp. NBC_00893]
MEFRPLGRSGLTISEIAYGNWLTHGSPVEEDAAVACIRAALDAGITTFDTADVYAETRAEAVLGRIVRSPIAQGALTGKYKPGAPLPAGSRATDDKGGANMVAGWLRDEVLERVQRLRPLADSAGLSLAQLAVAWVLQNSNVSAAIIGASRPEQVTENVAAAGVTLDAELLKGIDGILDPVVERNPGLTAGHAGNC